MSRSSRFAAALALALPAVVTAARPMDSGPPVPTKLLTALEHALREPTPPTTPAGRTANGREVTAYGNGALRSWICEPENVRLEATETEALGIYARLVVNEKAKQLVNEQVEGERRFSVNLPGSGWVVVAFVNDLYVPPADRNLTLGSLTVRNIH